MRYARLLLVAAGLGSVIYLIAVTGVHALLAPVQALSWRVAVLLVLPYGAVAVLRTLAWRLAFAQAPSSLGRLFSVRLAGEALNLGTASVGGEPLKVYLLRSCVPLSEASAAQVVDKTAITIGQVLFLGVGLVVTIPWFPLPHDFRRAMIALLAIQVLVVTAFVLVQCAGLANWALRVAARFGLTPSDERTNGVLRFDRTLAASYRERPAAVLACVALHLAGWLVGSLEVYAVLRWLDVDASFRVALAVDAFATGIKFLAFAIPGALGVLEGGAMLAFGVFGLGGGLGLSFTLVRRLRMLAWSAAGLVILAMLRAEPLTPGEQQNAERGRDHHGDVRPRGQDPVRLVRPRPVAQRPPVADRRTAGAHDVE